MGDELPIRVQIIDNSFSVTDMRSCKDYDFKILAEFLKNFLCIGSDVDAYIDVLLIGEADGDGHIGLAPFIRIVAVDQSLIQIEHNSVVLALPYLW